MKKKDEEAFMNAVLNSTLSKVQFTFKNHKLVKDESFFDYDLLKAALGRKHSAIVNFLMQKNCRVRNPNKKKLEKETAFHLAIKLDDQCVIKGMLDKGASIYDKNSEGEIPIYAAYRGKYFTAVNKILDYYWSLKNLNPENEADIIHFLIACTTDNLNLIEKFLHSGFDIDSCITSGMYSGYTALHFAVLHNQKKVVELLLKKHAQVNIKTSVMGVTPLHLACEYNYVKFYEINKEYNRAVLYKEPINLNWTSNCQNQFDIIRLLIFYGADIEAKDSFGKTPLFHAGIFDTDSYKLEWSNPFRDILVNKVSIRLREIIEILLCNKANINILTNDKSSILHTFSENSILKISKEVIKIFVDKGVDVDAVNDAGLTPIHVAVKSCNKQMVQNLIKHGANLNIKSKDSTIPLHVFAYKYLEMLPDEKDIFCLLLKYGSNVNMVYKNSSAVHYKKDGTFLHYIVSCRSNPYIVEKLLHYGADINMKDSEGNSPLCYIKFLQPDLDNSIKIFENFFSHIQKLQALGLYVSEQVLQSSTRMYKRYKLIQPGSSDDIFNRFNQIFLKCNEEKQKMEHIKINNDTSLYSIFKKSPHELSKCVRDTNFVKIIENCLDGFPLCGHLLEVQYRRGLVRRATLQSSKKSLIYTIGSHVSDLCLDLILAYLSDEDLNYVITAAKRSRNQV